MDPIVAGGLALAGIVLLVVLWKLLQLVFRVVIIAVVFYFLYIYLDRTFPDWGLPDLPSFGLF